MKLLLTYRLARIAIHLGCGMAKSAVLFPWLDLEGRNRRIRRWSTQLLDICGVHVAQPADSVAALEHAMVVANHVSWLDIFVINAVHPCRFVAKAEIRAWPILGWLAGRAGTIFISRGSKRDLRLIFQGLVDKLTAGERIAFFPEGTTAAQGQILPFHANLFEAAIDAQVPVQPFALVYVDDKGALHHAVDFIGDMSFAQSMVAILSGPPITARLTCLEPVATLDAHRRELAAATQAAVAATLPLEQLSS
ncbi:lysophospholipid acyltransferase family protein [Janthinobacterium sp. 64]|uniref:lysophospholipid acyltransferase family protein n=1 Tax=Janthinobacterium sp. 64 TaxID=2035208 RepID=UPI000C2BB3C2|nr:lysophospholipid acyltransferase family protein [Janthinobacterium sp. 64]PKB22118.1 1-acyl-sn-glycerol-3-phosphate acyltransferase [Janthinobacterium sp. 64]